MPTSATPSRDRRAELFRSAVHRAATFITYPMTPYMRRLEDQCRDFWSAAHSVESPRSKPAPATPGPRRPHKAMSRSLEHAIAKHAMFLRADTESCRVDLAHADAMIAAAANVQQDADAAFDAIFLVPMDELLAPGVI